VINFEIRPIRESDIAAQTVLHQESLPDDVLPNLGEKTLLRYYKKSFVERATRTHILLGAFQQQQLVGFCQVCVGGTNFIEIVRLDTLLALARLILLRPTVLCNGIVQFLHASSAGDKTAEIAFIAVSPGARGNGVGTALILRAMDLCKEKSVQCFQTKTSNERFCEFYKKTFGAKEILVIRGLGAIYHVLRWPCQRLSRPEDHDVK
jgi:ribosomal protein S18 acetylase RimI-like enzyme